MRGKACVVSVLVGILAAQYIVRVCAGSECGTSPLYGSSLWERLLCRPQVQRRSYTFSAIKACRPVIY